MRKFLDGFFWGLGFATAVVSIFVAYSIVGHVEVERIYQRSMNQLLEKNMTSFIDSLALELKSSKVVEDDILITTRMNNLGFTANSFGLSIRFSLYNNSGEFMGQCVEALPAIDSKEEKIDMLSICKTRRYQARDFAKATLAVVKQ